MIRSFKPTLFLLLIAFMFWSPGGVLTAKAQGGVLAPLIVAELAKASAGSKAVRKRLEAIRTWYTASNHTPIWIKSGTPSAKARALLKVLQSAREEALEPSDYNAEKLARLFEDGSPEGQAKLEVGLSRSLVAYGQHLNAGRVQPKAVNREIVIYPKAVITDAIMFAAVQSGDLSKTLRSLAPKTVRYARMRDHLATLRSIAANGGWVVLPKGPVLKPGMGGEIVPLLAKRLVQSGDLKADTITDDQYGDTLVEAVKRYQRRLALDDDGIVGPGTLGTLNKTVQQRIREVELNMERRRWMQNDYGPYYVFVNLADQVLKLVRNEKTIHTALVQVGKPYHRTPVFTDEMEYLELNPYWNVPYSIATKEYLPKLLNNPGVLTRQNIEVLAGGKAISPFAIDWSQYSRAKFPFRLRQKPGKKNALGRIKFMFPNKYNIYIHDTPSKNNFSRASRYFSHGCIRVMNPLALAERILASEGWTRSKIDRVVRSGKRTVKKLKGKIPVHVAYLTAWVNKDGSVHYRNDIYGRDKILDKALKRVRGG